MCIIYTSYQFLVNNLVSDYSVKLRRANDKPTFYYHFRLCRNIYFSLYVSYLQQIGLNLSGQKGGWLQPFATMINCSLWVAYGLLKEKRDLPISLANAPGVILGLITFVTAL